MYILRPPAAGILYAPPFYTPPTPRRVFSGEGGGVGVHKIWPRKIGITFCNTFRLPLTCSYFCPGRFFEMLAVAVTQLRPEGRNRRGETRLRGPEVLGPLRGLGMRPLVSVIRGLGNPFPEAA